jgi:hypothetical protein
MIQSELSEYSSDGIECPECGDTWESYHSYGSHYQHCGEGRPLLALIGKEQFKQDYQKHGKSYLEERLPCDDNTIVRAANTLGIAEKHGGDIKSPPNFWMSPDGYECWTVYDGQRESHTVRVHRLVAIAEYGFDAVSGNVVHHKNQIPWDNRPENLEPMSRGEHSELHNAMR